MSGMKHDDKKVSIANIQLGKKSRTTVHSVHATADVRS